MSSRGRGYGSRGGYGRGGGGYSSYRGGVSSYRGGGSSHRGGGDRGRGGYGGYDSGHSMDRYNSGHSSDRYGSGRGPEPPFKKPFRSDAPSGYGSREHISSRGSPERKRMRLEDSVGGRRSHDGGNHYSSRHDSYSNDRRGYMEQRRSSSRDNSYRKTSSAPSPRSPSGMRTRGVPRGARSSISMRRSYRGRTMRSSRGTYRGVARMRSFSNKAIMSSRPFPPLRRHPVKIRSGPKTKHDSATSSEEEDEEEASWEMVEPKTVKEEISGTPVKSPTKHEPEADGEATDKEAVDAASGDEREPLPRSKVTGRSFIRLTCPHCKEKCLTFKLYGRHLQSNKHHYVMDDVASKLKFMLLRMRTVQRNAQREVEDGNSVELSETPLFCPLCKLNHRTSRQEHCRSEYHRNIKKFLSPYCRICQISLRTPMLYEHHICSLDHLKNKARVDLKTTKLTKAKKSASGDEGANVDLDNFMTLDSVGNVDDIEDDDSSGEKKTEDDKEKKVAINVGNEHVKKLEVFYCELCRMYLPRGDDETVLRIHCRQRSHLSRYVRYRDDRTLRRQAERIHRIHQQAKENKQAEKESSDANAESSTASGKAKPKENGASANIGDEETEGDEKLWGLDVDKELGDLLRDVGQGDSKYSDDEEDSNVGRYDRFRKSDKKGDLETSKTETTGKTDATSGTGKASEEAHVAVEAAAKN